MPQAKERRQCRTRRFSAACLVLSFVATPALMFARTAHAQSQPELHAARELFSEAFREEKSGEYESALAKYRQVQQVKDTANVRYRIGACLEALGKYASALSEYEAAVHLGGGDKANAEVVRAAAERVSKVASAVPSLTLIVPATAPADTEVRLDDTKVDAVTLKDPILVDPGTHTVEATATGAVPFRSTVQLGQGSKLSLTIALEAAPSNPPVPKTSTPAPTESPEKSENAATTNSPSRVPAIAFTTAGGVLVAGSLVLLAMRQSDISELNTNCPGGPCTGPRTPDELNAARSRALWEGPVALGLGIAGVAALGVGVYFWLKPGHPNSNAQPVSSAEILPAVDARGGGLRLRCSF